MGYNHLLPAQLPLTNARMTSQGQSEPANSVASHLPRPESILILHNVTKDSNFGFLFRTAAAFGVS